MGEQQEQDDTEQRWTSYSDYESQVQIVSETVYQANDAYSYIISVEAQGVPLEESDAVDVKRCLVRAGARLLPEIRKNKEQEPFDDIWERWNGEDGEGKMSELRRLNLYDGVPDWLHQYNEDVMTAAWEIGYLQAGREEPADPEDNQAMVTEVID